MSILRALFCWFTPTTVTEVTGAELVQALRRAGVACEDGFAAKRWFDRRPRFTAATYARLHGS